MDCSKRDEIYSAAKKVKFYLELEICQGWGRGTWKCGGDGHIDSLHKVVEKHCGCIVVNFPRMYVWLVTDLQLYHVT